MRPVGKVAGWLIVAFGLLLVLNVNQGSDVVTNCHRLKLEAPDGKFRETDCANTKGIFRIIHSIPSPKVEPFKQWLAQVGYERFQEIENPDIGFVTSGWGINKLKISCEPTVISLY
jgi:hypothetical protein